MDLRVDDHLDPIEELDRIYQLQQLYFGETDPEDVLEVRNYVKGGVLQHLTRLGYISTQELSDEELYEALITYLHTKNFEARPVFYLVYR
ncbi:putative peptidoglycan binding domain-containing protein [Halobacillus litoralis]|uniref:putative peptidoglycan binding domain-containing protein n=1 Tax=Halobacillus litoralis TaxID=45668 RepID=UPI001CFF3958|nr:putative peptidoglycan binding domain-containing protein [Halobacillus litoralis]WLR46607.1 putative peptidoglycan binding domain-containing protein [Halobacillus litoralis]